MRDANDWDLVTDIVVVGSGGAGLAAALVAHDEGSRVTLIEKSAAIGGATALSGGVVWVPNNHLEKERGIDDSREEAVAYLKFVVQGRVDEELVEAFVDKAPEMLEYIEQRVGLRFRVSKIPDFHADRPGGKREGRSLGPPEFDTNLLGKWVKRLRRAPVVIFPMSWEDYEACDTIANPNNMDLELFGRRMRQGIVGMGMATIGYLFKGCLDRGIEPLMETRAWELIMEDERVIGLRTERGGKEFRIRVSQAVILASGGFEWNDELKAAFIAGPYLHALSHPDNEGDGLKLAMAAGASLGNMNEFWGVPSIMIPGEEYEGKQLVRMTMGERALPHIIMVNRYGQRFTDEAHNYSDVAKTMCTVDPVAYDYRNHPAWLVFDQQFRDKYAMMTIMPGAPSPEWLARADTLEELANQVGIDADGLETTIERFNGFARKGTDRDFDRGRDTYDRYCGDERCRPNPVLGTIERRPYFAIPVVLGTLGTKGGPRTNADGQVLHVLGDAIPGLYAAGNVMAGITGPGYPGSGGTISAGMTWGYVAAMHAARQPKE